MREALIKHCIHGKGNLGAKPRGEVVADILAAIKERRA